MKHWKLTSVLILMLKFTAVDAATMISGEYTLLDSSGEWVSTNAISGSIGDGVWSVSSDTLWFGNYISFHDGVTYGPGTYSLETKDDYEKWKYRGLKLHQCADNFKNDSEEMKQLSKFAVDKKLPIFIHVFSKKEAKRLVKTMYEFPETNFTLAHLMGLEEVIKHGKDLINVYFDTSTYYITSKKRIMKAIRHFGADHVIMGSDSPFGNENLANIKKKIESLEISNEEKNLVLGGSIAKLLEL